MKKFHFMAFAGAFVLFFAMTAQAAVTPTINGNKGKTKNSIQLQIQDAGLKNKKVQAQLFVDEINDDEDDYTLKYSVKLNGSGKAYLKVNGLDQGTTYRFSVKVRLHPEDVWSSWSEYYQTTTKGSRLW